MFTFILILLGCLYPVQEVSVSVSGLTKDAVVVEYNLEVCGDHNAMAFDDTLHAAFNLTVMNYTVGELTLNTEQFHKDFEEQMRKETDRWAANLAEIYAHDYIYDKRQDADKYSQEFFCGFGSLEDVTIHMEGFDHLLSK